MGKGMGLGGHLRSAQDDGTYASSTRGVLNPQCRGASWRAPPPRRATEKVIIYERVQTHDQNPSTREESFHTRRAIS